MILQSKSRILVVSLIGILIVFAEAQRSKRPDKSAAGAKPRSRRQAADAPAENGTAAAPAPAATTAASGDGKCDDFNSPTRPDPFPGSIRWAQFVKQMDELVVTLKNVTKGLTTILTDTNPEFASNKTDYLGNFLLGFNSVFQPMAALFAPHDRVLLANRAHDRIDPAVDLMTIDACFRMARADPQNNYDKGRVKWIEVNAMATTLHHIFDRLSPMFSTTGLEDVVDVVELVYPSWVATSVINASGSGYEPMKSDALTSYIHTEMDSLGDKHHLIPVLERMLCRKYGYKDWNPDTDRLNRLCYGNKKPYDLIHDNWDVLIDAAKFLVLSDMKYAVAMMSVHVFNAYQNEKGLSNGTKPDLPKLHEELMASMTSRIDKKIKFSPLATLPENVTIVEGPFVFHCSPTPVGNCSDQDRGLCPEGVYLQNDVVYYNGEELPIPRNVFDSVSLPDGTPLTCIKLVRVGVSVNGSEVPCNFIGGKCVDMDTKGLQEPIESKIVPRLVDAEGVVLHRDPTQAQEYAEGCQWGNPPKCQKQQYEVYPPCEPLPPGDNGTGTPGSPAGPCEWKICDNVTDATRPCLNSDLPGLYVDCRPPGLDANNTAEMEQALSAYFESELVLNPKAKCLGTCKEYQTSTSTCGNNANCELNRRSHCEVGQEDCMRNSKCPNHARRCERTSKSITYCPGKNGTGKNYEWVNVSGKITYSIKLADAQKNVTALDYVNPPCEGGKIMRANQRWVMEMGIILNTPEYCEICHCVCEDPTTAEGQYYWDVAALKADTAKGFAVTGLRFEKRNKTFVLNLQHGKILPGGLADPTTLAWLEATAHEPVLIPFGSQKEQYNKINLDIIEPGTPRDLVTGLQWKVADGTLNLEVGFSAFDEKGTADGEPKFRGPLYPPPAAVRTKIDMSERISPLRQLGPSQPYPYSDNAHQIQWDASSLSKDGGNAVIPFIDLLPLHSHDERFRPLKNVEVLYQSRAGVGGFISVAAKF